MQMREGIIIFVVSLAIFTGAAWVGINKVADRIVDGVTTNLVFESRVTHKDENGNWVGRKTTMGMEIKDIRELLERKNKK